MTEKIVAVKKGADGGVAAIKTQSGKIYSMPLAIEIAQAGGITGIQAMTESRGGGYVLQSTLGVGSQGQLHSLPTFD